MTTGDKIYYVEIRRLDSPHWNRVHPPHWEVTHSRADAEAYAQEVHGGEPDAEVRAIAESDGQTRITLYIPLMSPPYLSITAVLDRARRLFNGSDAEFDFSLATGAPEGAARAIDQAMYELANAHLDAVAPSEAINLERRDANHRGLRKRLDDDIAAYTEKCRARKYTVVYAK